MRGLLGDDVMFEAVYNQVPRSSDMLHFPKDVLRADFYLPEPGEGMVRPVSMVEHPPGCLDRKRHWKQDLIKCCKNQQVQVAMGFDPAAGQTKDASFSAATVVGACLHCGRRYVIDYWAARTSPETHPGTIISFLEAYPRISRLRIEINAYQAALARDPRLANIEMTYAVTLDEWNTDSRKWDPRLGIPQMARHVKNGLYSIPYAGKGDHEYAEGFIKSFIRWPKPPNDIPMSAWLADLSLMETIEDYRQIDAEIMPGMDRWVTQAHIENTIEVDLGDPDLWDQSELIHV